MSKYPLIAERIGELNDALEQLKPQLERVSHHEHLSETTASLVASRLNDASNAVMECLDFIKVHAFGEQFED